MSDSAPLYQLLQTGVTSDSYLGSVFEIEDVLLMIHDISAKVDHLKGLKAHRAQKINDEITKLESRTEELRNLIMNTMKHHDPKTKKLDYPDVGSVTRRSSKGSWEIENDDEVVDFFKIKGRESEVLAEVKPRLDKRKAKALIKEYQDNGVAIPGTKFKDASESLSITFESDVKQKDTPAPPSMTADSVNVDDLEALEV